MADCHIVFNGVQLSITESHKIPSKYAKYVSITMNYIVIYQFTIV